MCSLHQAIYILCGRKREQWICIMCIQVNLPHCTKSGGGGQDCSEQISNDNSASKSVPRHLSALGHSGQKYPWVLRQKEDLKKETFRFCQSQYMTACNFTKRCCQLWTLSGESGAVAVSSHKWIICHITLGRADVCRNLWKPLASLGNPSFPRSRLPLLHIPVLDLAACLISLFSCHPPS